MCPITPLGRWQPAQINAEYEDEHHSQPEGGEGLSIQSKYSSDVVPGRAAFYGRQYSEGNSRDDGKEKRRGGQLKCCGDTFGNDAQRRGSIEQGPAKISGQRLTYPDEVLQDKRLVLPHCTAHGRVGLGGGVLVYVKVSRVASHSRQGKYQETDQEDYDGAVNDSSNYERSHGCLSPKPCTISASWIRYSGLRTRVSCGC